MSTYHQLYIRGTLVDCVLGGHLTSYPVSSNFKFKKGRKQLLWQPCKHQEVKSPLSFSLVLREKFRVVISVECALPSWRFGPRQTILWFFPPGFTWLALHFIGARTLPRRLDLPQKQLFMCHHWVAISVLRAQSSCSDFCWCHPVIVFKKHIEFADY